MTGVYNELAVCKTRTGHAEEEIALQEKADQLNPRSPWRFSRYRHTGFAYLLLGKDEEAIKYLQRSLAIKPEVDLGSQWNYRSLAAAFARSGRLTEAKLWLSKADRLWPFDTVRGQWPHDSASSVYRDQIRGFQAALRLAGEREHADEYADFAVPPDGDLHKEFAGLTPMHATGVRTIRTPDLVRFLADTKPLVIDTMTYSWGLSIPSAIGLRHSGVGGNFSDAVQTRLHDKMRALLGDDRARPIVAVGWNSERFDGRNLALRLAVLGYTEVYWYRGGREAWEVSALPESEIVATDW